VFRTKKKKVRAAEPSRLERDENIALVEAALAGDSDGEIVERVHEGATRTDAADSRDEIETEIDRAESERIIEDAMRESGESADDTSASPDAPAEPARERQRDPEY